MKQNLQDGLAAQGYDVVSFFKVKPKKGSKDITAKHNGAVYQFSTRANQVEFEGNPDDFVPQYGGFCAIAMSEGAKANPNPRSWEVREGKLYFFTRMFLGIIDAKRQWVKNPLVKRGLADAEWEKING